MSSLAPVRPQPRDAAPAALARLSIAALLLPFRWWRRIRFRSQLREMLEGPDYLFDDVGFDYWDARKEAARPFWAPVAMTSTGRLAPPDLAP